MMSLGQVHRLFLQRRAYYTSKGETVELNYSSDMNLMKRNNKAISARHPLGTKMSKSPKSMMKESREQLCTEMERKGQIADKSSMFCESLFVTRPVCFVNHCS